MLLDMEQIAVTLTDGSIEEHGPDSDPEYAWGCMQDTASGDLIVFKYRDGSAPVHVTSYPKGTWAHVDG